MVLAAQDSSSKQSRGGRGECCECQWEAHDGFERLLRTGVVTRREEGFTDVRIVTLRVLTKCDEKRTRRRKLCAYLSGEQIDLFEDISGLYIAPP